MCEYRGRRIRLRGSTSNDAGFGKVVYVFSVLRTRPRRELIRTVPKLALRERVEWHRGDMGKASDAPFLGQKGYSHMFDVTAALFMLVKCLNKEGLGLGYPADSPVMV